jgi:hypothetical protein
MKKQNYKYIIHLKAGDIVNIKGIPYELFGDADFGGNSNPEDLDVEYEEIDTEKI